MSAYTVRPNPTGPSPVRNPGIRAVLTQRAEQQAAEQHANNIALWWYLNRRKANV